MRLSRSLVQGAGRLRPLRALSSLVPAAAPTLTLRPKQASFSAVKKALENTAIDSPIAPPNGFAYRVQGTDAQYVEIVLKPQEAVRAEVGSLFFMDDGLEFETTTGGGLMSGFKRMMTGESFFISDFVNPTAASKTVAFCPNHPTKIVPVLLPEHDGSIIAQKGAFLCGARDTLLEMHFTKNFSTGFFGGEGFVLQRVSGSGLAFLKGGGGMLLRELEDGETLRVSGGSLVAFETSVDFEVEMVKGGKNILFGGEGLFLTKLTGPGRIWLQSMPFAKLASAVGARTGGGGGGGIPIPMGGSGGSAEADADVDAEGGDDIPTLEGQDGGGESKGGGWFDALFGDDDK